MPPSTAGMYCIRNQTIHNILTNETYMEDKILQKTYVLDFMQKERIRNKGIVPMYHVEQDHEVIIPPETYHRVQDLIHNFYLERVKPETYRQRNSGSAAL